MTEDKTKRLSVYLPDKVKSDLEHMAAETGLSMTQVIVMATHSLLANYKSQGSAIFSSLLDTKQKESTLLSERIQTINQDNSKLQTYYGLRAAEYERIYHRDEPDYQNELLLIGKAMKDALVDRTVLEIACGTGYWTQIVAVAVKHITGTDIRPEVLQIAEAKQIPQNKASFLIGNAYELDSIPGVFNGALANFWFSHIPKNKLDDFLTGLHKRLGPGANVFMADNVYVSGRGGELVYKEDCEDTFKLRELVDGSRHEIVKNYYSKEELYDIFKPMAKQLKVFAGNSFWYVSYTI
ncbi:methyltransferase domain-containing protein [Paenibacillus radicis (ex Xue et al. 2023)]|uniref:Methyltransferase domain-containing protein n=1 Tax=Paenibacillus radicis (ex Xue et al. 2023) TaxID=2972489 RepID=A0ABT1YE38_9BACL|nr:methyltransferase domain-containing protein [Paenibacillus radicis (ex Xue et al. 2023)]MCR8630689.1 methyltransferase domain-containing protein [Paenibacillus radicis (ex Xue et al. 2023)]